MFAIIELAIIILIGYFYYKSNNFQSKNLKSKYQNAKNSYAEDCKKFDNITTLNDDAQGNSKFISMQDDAIKYSRQDLFDEPIKEFHKRHYDSNIN